MGKIRTYQFGAMAAAAFGYFFLYRRFLHPKSIVNSHIYNHTIKYLKAHYRVKELMGGHLQVMNCNGKMYPMSNYVDFELFVFGSDQKGKFKVSTTYEKETQVWQIKQILLHLKDGTYRIL
mmetsp:Transcript_12639/g.9167  ORF Transcript_12639/g.9167 Transcript_12639/m.9167 type:complete len:121 (+) Transcript_12639:743-1105(+)